MKNIQNSYGNACKEYKENSKRQAEVNTNDIVKEAEKWIEKTMSKKKQKNAWQRYYQVRNRCKTIALVS